MELLRASAPLAGGKVDRDAGMIRGMVLAQEGPFKTQRGRFDSAALGAIAKLVNKSDGVPSHYGHPGRDGNTPHPYLGMVSNARVDGDKVRGDLAFAKSAYEVPVLGNLAGYVMQRTEDNARSISSSLGLFADKVPETTRAGRSKLGEDGQPLPPLWKPTEILTSDIVGVGDAVDSLLSATTNDSAFSYFIRSYLGDRYGLNFDGTLTNQGWQGLRTELRVKLDDTLAALGWDREDSKKRRDEAIAKVDKLLGNASN